MSGARAGEGPRVGDMTTVQIHTGTAVMSSTTPVISVRDLVKSIDDRPVLRGVSFEVTSGDYVALLGANGAGKSTLLRVIATLTPATSGTVELFGQKLTRAAVDLRRRIGMVGHQSMLYRDLSARENLAFFAGLYGVPDPGRRVKQMLDLANLSHRANDPVKAFSRGMTQRLAIGRALLHDPDLILADEPFAGLDAPSMSSLEALLQELNAGGKTIVLVNHDIEQTLRIAERAIVLRGGKVGLDEPTHRLYAREVLTEVSRS